MTEITFSLRPRPPFRLDLTVWALRRRAHNVVDRFDGQIWRRVLVIDGEAIGVAVTQTAFGSRPEIEVRLSATQSHAVQAALAESLTMILGLERDLGGFYRLAQNDPILAPLASRLSGMRPPRYPTVFEAFANAVACQLVSLSAGMHVLNRLADQLGAPHQFDGIEMRAFPLAETVALADPDSLRALGLSLPKAGYLIGLAGLGRDSRDFGDIGALDDATAIARLREIRGVGRWTAEYVLLRGFGRINIFPGDDVGGRNKLVEWLGIRERLDYDGVGELVRRWHPYAGLIYLHLLVDGVTAAGGSEA